MSRSTSDRTGELIRLPRQARSRETMDRILETLEEMLNSRSFDKITISELAKQSGTGASSIYGRFKDKSALILGVHMRLRERALSCLAQLTDPNQWADKSIAFIVESFTARAMSFYLEHRTLIRAALYLDDPVVRERQASVVRTAAHQISELITPRAPHAADEINRAIDTSCRLFISVTYNLLMFDDVALVRSSVSEEELIGQLATIITALVEKAVGVPAQDQSGKAAILSPRSAG